ncbi:polysaccharide lyase family 8 super-sandwich domain-containing protein, partial [Streptomyces sp. SM12]|uniref:polysaccharide lyase family 8 super-sandwich domain-containing protein n=1 Tax=Streptomyces sp. SM12 TaxID=1071602 RepID=UPI000CD4FF38
DEHAPTPWPDLPLDATEAASANVTAVAGRLRALAVACATEASELYGDAAAAGATAAGLRVWWRARYHAGQPQYGNWWDWEIGSPRALTDTLTLLGGAVDDETRAGLLAAVDHFVPDPRRMLRGELWSTGANLVDLCRVVALRGVLGRDEERLALGSSSLSGVLDPVRVGDGFHPDGSFIMHTSVAYPGTYGQVLVKGMAEMMRLLAGTEWDVAERERRLTTEAVDRTFLPLVHQGLMLDAVRGRAVARHNATDADDGFKLAVDLVTLAGALPGDAPDASSGTVPGAARGEEEAGRLRAVAKDWLLSNAWRPLDAREPTQIATAALVLADDAVRPRGGPLGHFGFPDMERFVHRRPGWSYCLSLNSDRVARYEYMNGENAHGWHTGDGMALLVLDGDLHQYTDAYWPTADPKRLPGITVDTAELPVGAGGDNDNVPLSGTRWSGQVRLGDIALAAMDLRGVDSPLRARTSWLFLDDGVLTAGSGITADGGRRAETVVDHRSLHDPADPAGAVPGELRVDGRPVGERLGETVRHPTPRWAHLGGTGGYVFLRRPGGAGGAGELLSLREDRTGAWRDIREGGPTAPVTRRYLTLLHDHGSDPHGASYAHLVLPGATFAETAARAAYPGVEVLELSGTAHAFRTTPGGLPGHRAATLTALVFFTAGTAAGVTVDGPCAVLLLEGPGALRIAVCDPSRSVPAVRVTLGPRAARPHQAVRETGDGVTVLTTGPRTELLVETGGAHGASRTITLAPGSPVTPRHARLSPPEASATVRAGRHSGDPQGDPARLRVHQASGADGTSRAYLRFGLPAGVRGEEIERAVLWVYGAIPKDPDSRESDMLQHPLRARTAADRAWEEATVTWDTAPEPGAALGTDWVTTYPDWAGLDVTEAARGARGRLTVVLDQAEEGHETLLDGRGATANPPLLQLVTTTRR